MRARPFCPGRTVAAVVMSPWPRSSSSAARSSVFRSSKSSWLNSSTGDLVGLGEQQKLLAQQLLLGRKFLRTLLHLFLHLGRRLRDKVGIFQPRLVLIVMRADFLELFAERGARTLEVETLRRHHRHFTPSQHRRDHSSRRVFSTRREPQACRLGHRRRVWFPAFELRAKSCGVLVG